MTAKKAEEGRAKLAQAAKATAESEEAHPVQGRSIRDEGRRRKALGDMDRARKIMAPSWMVRESPQRAWEANDGVAERNAAK